MNIRECKLTDCTVAATGTCLLHTNPDGCENLLLKKAEADAPQVPPSPEARDASQSNVSARTFHSGMELGTQDAVEIMRSRYAYLIGILGCTDAGKTCFMSSLYLLAACQGLMPHYRFAGSLTLQGFEDRVRKLRRWEAGILPKSLSDHTGLADPRTPSLLHVSLQAVRNNVRFDLLLTDLPGEWTKDLIDNVEVAKRFRFLNRADGIIIVIDGPSLVTDETRHIEVLRFKVLLSRLAHGVKIDNTIPLIVLISKCDKLNDVPSDIKKLMEEAQNLGFVPEVLMVAAFSSLPDKIANGTGVMAAIEKILDRKYATFYYNSEPTEVERRGFQRFRI